jgi:hypothetical protein
MGTQIKFSSTDNSIFSFNYDHLFSLLEEKGKSMSSISFAVHKVNIVRRELNKRFNWEDKQKICQELVNTHPAELICIDQDSVWGHLNGVGQNNLGKVLMEIRESLIMSSLLTPLGELKAKQKQVEVNRMYNFDFNRTDISTEEAQAILEEIGNDSRLTEIDLKWLGLDYSPPEKWNELEILNNCRLLAAYLNIGESPFPYRFFNQYKEVVIIDGFSGHIELDCILASGLKVTAARWNNRELKLEGFEYSQQIKEYKGDTPIKDTLFLSDKTKANVPYLNVSVLRAHNLINILEKLTAEEAADFIASFANLERVAPGVIQLHTTGFLATYATATINFIEEKITTGREFNVRSKGFLTGFGLLQSSTLMALLTLQIVGLNNQKVAQTKIDGTIAFLTQLWEEEDLYGQVMDSNQQLRTIRSNTASVLGVEKLGVFPYFRLVNNNTRDGVLEAVNYCIENKIPFFTDKNAMKRLVLGAGVTALAAAMLFDEEDGIAKLTTILDVAKPGKVLNRGWNMVAIAAEEGLPFQKYFNKYEQAGLVLTDKATNIIVRGDKRMTLTHDGRVLTNGSGVGMVNRTKGFSYSARKTLRGTLNAISLKEGESLNNVAAQIESELSEILSSGEIIRSNGRKEDKIIYSFRGKELIKYRGLNQDIILSSEHGASFKVHKLATSKSISVQVTVIYFADDYEVKGRGIGIKAVLKKASKTTYVLDENNNKVQWEVALNSECLKGNASRIHQYCEYLLDLTGKQSYLNVGESTLTAPSGKDGEYEVQDLKDEGAKFYQWWSANTKEFHIRSYVDYENYFKPLMLAHVGMADKEDADIYAALAEDANKDIALVNPKTGKYVLSIEEAMDTSGKLVYVEETVRGVLAPFTFQVEMATVRECTVAAQSPTLQQLCATYAAKPELGYNLLQDAQDTENGILGCAAMALNDPSISNLDNSPELSKEGANWEKVSFSISAKVIANELNLSKFGMGYADIYNPNEDPFFAFSEPGVEKKFKASGLVNTVGLTQTLEGGKFNVLQVIEGTSWNYQVNVGTGYNVASVLTCEAALARYALVRAAKAGNKESAMKALKRLRLAAQAQGMGWITGYEDSWLAGFNFEGMALADELHEFRKGYTDDFKTFSGKIREGLTASKVIERLQDRLEAIAGIKFDTEVVKQFLWAYRIARGISAIEKYSSTESVQKAFALSEEDMHMLGIAGAMRRSDQGKFGNFITELSEDEDETGVSVWTYLGTIWEKVQDTIPYFLRRKLYKSMIVQSEFAGLTRQIVAGIEGGKPVEGNRVKVSNDYAKGTTSIVVSLPEGEIECSVVPLEFGSRDEKFVKGEYEEPYGTVLADGEWYSFGELGGAFEYEFKYCPLNEDGTRDLSRVPDKTVKLKSDYGFDETLHFWFGTLSSQEIIKRAALRYPNGCLIESLDGTPLEVYFDFNALLRSAAFMTGGQSTGIALNIAELLINISRPYANRPSGWSTRARNLLSGVQGQMREMMKKGLLRRIGRTRPFAQGSKVMTSHSVPNVDVIEGGETYSLPVFLVNPKDDLVKAGGYLNGDYVAVFRTPMIAKCYGVLIFDETVSIGHIECNAFLNAKTHRGDGDGDPCAIERLGNAYEEEARVYKKTPITQAYAKVLDSRR